MKYAQFLRLPTRPGLWFRRGRPQTTRSATCWPRCGNCPNGGSARFWRWRKTPIRRRAEEVAEEFARTYGASFLLTDIDGGAL